MRQDGRARRVCLQSHSIAAVTAFKRGLRWARGDEAEQVPEGAHWPTLSDAPQLFKRASESAYLAGIVEAAARRLLFE